MAWLPYHDEASQLHYLSDSQLLGLAVTQYIDAVLFLMLFAWTGYNFWVYIIRQGKYRSQPLLLFYLLQLFLTLARVFYSIYFLECELEQHLICLYGPPTLKASLGLAQFWMMLELSLRIRHSVKHCRDPESVSKIEAQSLERRIQCGRTILIIFVSIFILAVTTLLLIKGHQMQQETLDDQFAVTVQLSDFYMVPTMLILAALLTAVICYLYFWMRRLQRLESGGTGNAFKGECCTLFSILVVFDSTYLLRAVFDATRFGLDYKEFSLLTVTLVIMAIFDIVPLTLIMYLHQRNSTANELRHDDFDHEQEAQDNTVSTLLLAQPDMSVNENDHISKHDNSFSDFGISANLDSKLLTTRSFVAPIEKDKIVDQQRKQSMYRSQLLTTEGNDDQDLGCLGTNLVEEPDVHVYSDKIEGQESLDQETD